MDNLPGLALMVFTPSIIMAIVLMARRPGRTLIGMLALGVASACAVWLLSAALSQLQLLTGWRAYGIDLSSIALIMMVAGLLVFPLILTLATLLGLKDHQGTLWPGFVVAIVAVIVLHNTILDTAPINGLSIARLVIDGLAPIVLWPPYRIGVRWLRDRLLALGARRGRAADADRR